MERMMGSSNRVFAFGLLLKLQRSTKREGAPPKNFKLKKNQKKKKKRSNRGQNALSFPNKLQLCHCSLLPFTLPFPLSPKLISVLPIALLLKVCVPSRFVSQGFQTILDFPDFFCLSSLLGFLIAPLILKEMGQIQYSDKYFDDTFEYR